MSVSNPVANMLTIVRNANMVYKTKVVAPHSRLKEAILKVLKEEGFISEFKVAPDPICGDKKKTLHIYLKYGPDKERVIRRLVCVSKPGRRIFVGYDKIPRVCDGFGIVILSTSKGIMSSRTAKALKIGGELIAKVW